MVGVLSITMETKQQAPEVKLKYKIDPEKYYVKPHKKISKIVEQKHVSKVLEAAEGMVTLCGVPRGKYPSAFAIAHPQVSKHPFRFFVTYLGQLVINPVIIRHTNQIIRKVEGCMSYPNDPMVTVGRWNKCEVEYQTVDENGNLTDKKVLNLSGREAEIWQHEIDHLDGIYIYDKQLT